MALRADYIKITVQQHSSGVAEAVIAESTSANVDFSAEALETTNQASGLNASFIAGKVSGTVSGDFLYASDGTNYDALFTKMNAGEVIGVAVERSGTEIIACSGVITSLNVSGGLSDALATGSYTIQLSGDPAVA